ncbi:hypothetical protein AMTRI_Chr03g139720 [Amborella trichopoda]
MLFEILSNSLESKKFSNSLLPVIFLLSLFHLSLCNCQAVSLHGVVIRSHNPVHNLERVKCNYPIYEPNMRGCGFGWLLCDERSELIGLLHIFITP